MQRTVLELLDQTCHNQVGVKGTVTGLLSCLVIRSGGIFPAQAVRAVEELGTFFAVAVFRAQADTLDHEPLRVDERGVFDVGNRGSHTVQVHVGFLPALLRQRRQQLEEPVDHVLRGLALFHYHCADLGLVCFERLPLYLHLVSLSRSL